MSNAPSLSLRTPFDLKISGRQFLRGGQPHRIFSGALHYFRIVPEYWRDRMLKCRAMGLNTIETYVAWNLHEPRPGTFSFDGLLDLRRFVSLAGDLGMDVILRPGPYICAEWEFGGLPAWLLADRSMKLRSMHPGFLDAVSRYFDNVLPQITDQLCTNGGPIVAVQIENEYGSYGNSASYLRWIEQALIDRGIDTLLFTSDGPCDPMLQGGTLPHILKTANFGSRATPSFAKLREYEGGPIMCMEFWNGWFDHWSEEHHIRDPKDARDVLEEILTNDASVNFYMAHGGTNFGFMNGANCDGTYQPAVTSYDYDAPIDEQGRPTPKYFAFQKILAQHGARIEDLPTPIPATAFGEVDLKESLHLFQAIEHLASPMRFQDIPTMEDVGQNYGFIHYRTSVTGPRPEERLFLQDVHDRALVFQDGTFVKIVDRNDRQEGIPIAVPAKGSQLDILVENLGRVNYGPMLHDRKGITVGVRLNNQFLSGWDVFPLELLTAPSLPWQGDPSGKPATFYHGHLEIGTPADTFLKVEGAHGIVWVNGFCLGRYWNIGPQKTLYIPAPLLKQGANAIVIFEGGSAHPPRATSVAKTVLG